MPWQLLLIAYLALGTGSFLIRRRLATHLTDRNRLVNAFFFVCTLYPLGLIVASFSSPDLRIGWLNALFLLVGSAIFPLVNMLAYKANKDVDAGLFSILSNIFPIVTIIAATLLLNETLSAGQLLGAAVIITSTFIATLPKLSQRDRSKTSGVILALISIMLLGLAIVFERWMLTRIDYGAYLVFGWGAQALWMALVAWPDRKHIHLLTKDNNFKYVLAYGITNSFKGLSFVSALKLSGNASVVTAFGSFTTVLVVVAAYFALGEKKNLWLKLLAAAAGVVGLVILNTA